jgi:hypothetical protein
LAGDYLKQVKQTVILVIGILTAVAALPTWPHSRRWGYLPSALLGLIVLILIMLELTGRL